MGTGKKTGPSLPGSSQLGPWFLPGRSRGFLIHIPRFMLQEHYFRQPEQDKSICFIYQAPTHRVEDYSSCSRLRIPVNLPTIALAHRSDVPWQEKQTKKSRVILHAPYFAYRVSITLSQIGYSPCPNSGAMAHGFYPDGEFASSPQSD